MTSPEHARIHLGSVEIGIDCVDPTALAPFWSLATGYRIGDIDPAGIYLDLIPPSAGLPVIYLQRVPEPKITKNHVHLDLYVDDVALATSILEAAGGAACGIPQTGSAGGSWQVMVDPVGNEFCLCQLSQPA